MKKICSRLIVAVLIGIACLLLSNYIESMRVLNTEVYIVQPYDTIWTIAERFRIRDCRDPYILSYIEELRAGNTFLQDTHYQLHAGDKLVIHYYTEY